MASMSFISSQAHWSQSSAPVGAYGGQTTTSVVDPSPGSPFDFVPQEMRPQAPIPQKSAPPPLPSFSFPQAPELGSPATSSEQADGLNHRDNDRMTGECLAAVPPQAVATAPAHPTLPNPGPGLSARGPGRRGHAHRRSAAISSVDLTAIAKAFPPKPVVGSTPSTPMDTKKHALTSDDCSGFSSRSLPTKGIQTPPLTPRASDDHLGTSPHAKRRHTEPDESRRPLSIISSDGSVSTLRPNNLQSGCPSPNTRSVTPTGDHTIRPKTAGAKFDFGPYLSSEPNEGLVAERPRTACASLALSNDKLGDSITPPNIRIPSHRHPLYNSTLPEDLSPALHRAPSSRKQAKKQKKMRPWAGILSRKGKKRTTKRPPSRRVPTPPPILTRTNSAMSSLYGVNFDDDNTVVIRTPTDPNAPRHPLASNLTKDTLSLDTSWKPQSFYDQGRDVDLFSPVIDLDAALGPFNTPEMGPERPVSGFVAATKRMYSGGRRGEFVGPEMRYHRRAESAPEMPPLDRNAFGLNRYSTAALLSADVFDEKEEDEFLAENSDSRPEDQRRQVEHSSDKTSFDNDGSTIKRNSTATIQLKFSNNNPGLGIQIVDIADELLSSNATTPQTIDSYPSSAMVLTPCTPDMEITGTPRKSKMHASLKDAIEILDVGSWGLQSDRASIPASPPSSLHCEKTQQQTPPTSSPQQSFPKAIPLNLGTFAPDSSFPSPDPSTTSFEHTRLTTPSSVIEKQASNSIYSGEPGSECFHNSVEDVPSLTSSASTMTGTIPQMSSGLHPRPAGDRCSSLSLLNRPRPASSQSTKRSSLVSLSRLVGVASGEKSKLSHEQKAPSDETEKKKKKGNRISRLMHFWKSKEKQKQDSQA
ncbi:hypothetical protein LOZ53_000166 [Ophidiomyces ophidiicola]|uniref:uncharacterized protein n=1 Tax=Ophidiomyces ophidiicola TaxID=1387563 RepID=UPI0020C42889|nr:uncharacterized protein LOZ57_002554 [Ophidiomyces ophidiicola]KAI1919558.1 hypothetical protein LOZ64_002255 [Ophidiomyces ophidiicola]KAI1949184.1 hypothetical protein LOZ57_002554 [Ophidiomyces ophidiicola]KAI1955261.1 hypothetical protein LOZ62_000387 [Ophidiomyces ophidiicola]KAI1967412.1 hypothetical protein LOZ59_000782 [Ophidiomyces ophidiicola]KAI1974739.1 hypothetical protein LOZ56_001039 [Ophidiomyces ophidiicola]